MNNILIYLILSTVSPVSCLDYVEITDNIIKSVFE